MTSFSGFMKVSLDTRLNEKQIIERSELTGDWHKNSLKILRKPRLFTVTAHIYNSIGAKAVTTINYRGKGGNKTIAEAAIMAFDAARNGTSDIDMSQSYIIIRA